MKYTDILKLCLLVYAILCKKVESAKGALPILVSLKHYTLQTQLHVVIKSPMGWDRPTWYQTLLAHVDTKSQDKYSVCKTRTIIQIPQLHIQLR